MAIINVLTAARMLEIEANSVVDGEVNQDGRLILTTHAGASIDAGDVVGPQGATGLPASTYLAADKPVTDTPSTYPRGVSQFQVGTANGWPSSFLIVFTIAENSNRIVQIASDKGNNNMWFRQASSSTPDAWTSWALISTKAYVDGVVGPKADKSYVDTLVKGQELGANVNLDTLTTPGVYWQSNSNEATTALKYPEALAGLLEIFGNGVNMVWQRYTPYGVNGNRVYIRGWYNTTGWDSWRLMESVPSQDTGWVDITANLEPNFVIYSAGVKIMYRKKNGTITICGAVKPATSAAASAIATTGGANLLNLDTLGLNAGGNYFGYSLQHGSTNDYYQTMSAGAYLIIARYYPGTPSTGVWLPFSHTYLQ